MLKGWKLRLLLHYNVGLSIGIQDTLKLTLSVCLLVGHYVNINNALGTLVILQMAHGIFFVAIKARQ